MLWNQILHSKLGRTLALLARRMWRTKSFWLRGLFCWLIGVFAFFSDNPSDFDTRMDLRAPQPIRSPIVLLEFSEQDWAELHLRDHNVVGPLKDIVSFSDSLYWDTKLWAKILSLVLKDQPKAVGVSLFFSENFHYGEMSAPENSIFKDPRIFWSADLDSSGRPLLPSFATHLNRNLGVRGVRPDEDGVIRRFHSALAHIPHLSVRLTEQFQAKQKISQLESKPETASEESQLINFMGPSGTFPKVGLQEILSENVPKDFFKDRIVIIGTTSASFANPDFPQQAPQQDWFLTPVGKLSRAEVLANIADNLLGKKWIRKFSNTFYFTLLFLLMLLSVWIIRDYPQSVALVFFVWVGTLLAALSAWVFDSFFFWIPIRAPVFQLGATYIVFLSYQLTLNENRAWRLHQDKKNLEELEELKNNFVSMMSHDLKTPIAKIQAIADRLLAQANNPIIEEDLRSLRRTSDDLHKYIQSILRVTKIEARDLQINRGVVDLNEIVENVVQRLSPLAKQKKQNITLELEPLFSIEADAVLVQEVIQNLLDNAIQYSKENTEIKISSFERNDYVFLYVTDQGPGIDDSEQKEIFNKFTRGKGSTQLQGTGLGLYFVKYFVELHGGQIFLKSEKNVGTEIGFSLPVQ